MRLTVLGAETFVATGGRPFDPALPAMVFLHGAGLDHSVWALLARAFAYHGCAVLAPDLPGHGHSAGAPLKSIGAIADWTAALIKQRASARHGSSAIPWDRSRHWKPPRDIRASSALSA
jgi:pimeloyl-ACP methyl ester carboxylesterase